MSVLAIRLEGPMQSWGAQSHFQERDTAREPTKSGVIGLICSALGRSRDQPVEDLSKLKMAIRIDREGTVMRDFQTTGDVARASGRSTQNTVVSNRYFLSDACFVVLLEGDEEKLNDINRALSQPFWSLFLGRKSYLPSSPLVISRFLLSMGIDEALRKIPFQGRAEDDRSSIRVVNECSPGTGEVIADVPISFADRNFGTRYIATSWMDGKELPLREVIERS